MTINLYKGKDYKKIIEEIMNDHPEGYVIKKQKETKNKFLFWMKEYELVVESASKKQVKPEKRSNNILEAMNRNVISEDELIEALKEEGKEKATTPKKESSKEVIERIKKEVAMEKEEKEKELIQQKEEKKQILVEKLIEREIDQNIAKELVNGMTQEEIESEEKMDILKKKMIEKMKTINGYNVEEIEILALIGPTGVGKTTTIAKLAGGMVAKNYKVGMVTTDVYRVGAIAQLEIYANILEVEMHIAHTKEELKEKIELMKMHGVEKILIDTVGRSPMDTRAIDDVGDYIEVAKPSHTSLVLSATQKTTDIDKIIKNFKDVKTDSLIFTKLDETATHGIIFNTVQKSGKPISYVTNGQNVPNEIYRANSEELVEKIVGEVNEFGSSIFTA